MVYVNVLKNVSVDCDYGSEPAKPHLQERIESRNGVHTIEVAAKPGIGSGEYELVEVKKS